MEARVIARPDPNRRRGGGTRINREAGDYRAAVLKFLTSQREGELFTAFEYQVDFNARDGSTLKDGEGLEEGPRELAA